MQQGFTPFPNLSGFLERLLGEVLDQAQTAAQGQAQPTERDTPSRAEFPPLNISADKDCIYVRCELPGVPLERLELLLTDAGLSIKGERPAPQGRVLQRERPAGPFHRLVTLSAPVRREAVTATLKDGLLTVVLPKVQPAPPRRVPVS